MTIDVERRPEPIATGRTWRDIPPSPPTEAPPRLLSPVEPPSPRRDGLRRWRSAALIGVLALAIGVALGISAPWQEAGPDASAAEPAPPAAALPEQIVPPPAPDPQTPGSLLPDDFYRFDGFPDLSQLFGEEFGRRSVVPETLDLIELRGLPEGYRIAGTSFHSSPGLTAEELSLSGPAGPVTVRAERSSPATMPDGRPHRVGDIGGVLVAGDPTLFAWLAEDDLVVTIAVPESAGLDLVAALVPSVEVVR